MGRLLAGVAILALMFAPSAQAEAADDYLNGLQAGGISFDTTGTAFEIGGTVCDSFRRGLSDAKVSAMLGAAAQLDWDQAHVVIANATSYLCPDVPVA